MPSLIEPILLAAGLLQWIREAPPRRR